jgi:adenine-specific DNA-methyltransferase
MSSFTKSEFPNRYGTVTHAKSIGATYTPKLLADFVAHRMMEVGNPVLSKEVIRILDPAVGDGELLVSLLQSLDFHKKVEVYGFDTDEMALIQTKQRLERLFPDISLQLKQASFLDYVLDSFDVMGTLPMFANEVPKRFDLIIANPPYVRTQIMGAHQARLLAKQFGLTGRVDLYYAFLVAIAAVLEPQGVAGIIVSNRFMTTKSGGTVRAALWKRLKLHHVWDLGDTKIFDAAVLPCVLLAQGKASNSVEKPAFTSIYETTETEQEEVHNLIAALAKSGVVALPDGRRYTVTHGKLDINSDQEAIWRVATEDRDTWLATIEANTWGRFRDIGKIRVGVKTCADKVFIRSDWEAISANERPELLRPLTTHHVARQFKALEAKHKQILYTHEIVEGRRQAVALDQYPRAGKYLAQHRAALESRKYVTEAGRQWFEIWVPQDPAAWNEPKLVFRDISEEPVFWIDQEKTIVNGDCYWMIAERPENQELLWLAAAVANSTLVEAFYDRRFNNKLYAGRRRFMTQYVEQFPLPDPQHDISRQIIETARAIYNTLDLAEIDSLKSKLDALVWQAFGL